jgi:hypothetical protein
MTIKIMTSARDEHTYLHTRCDHCGADFGEHRAGDSRCPDGKNFSGDYGRTYFFRGRFRSVSAQAHSMSRVDGGR